MTSKLNFTNPHEEKVMLDVNPIDGVNAIDGVDVLNVFCSCYDVISAVSHTYVVQLLYHILSNLLTSS